PRLVDQRHISDAAPTERVAKACDQFQASSTAADDDDAMRGVVAACHINYHLTASITGRSANLFPSPEAAFESGKLPMLLPDPLRSLGSGSLTRAGRQLKPSPQAQEPATIRTP